MPSGSPLAGKACAQGKGAIARKGMFTSMIFEGRLTRDKVRRKAEFSSPSYFVNRSFVLRNSPVLGGISGMQRWLAGNPDLGLLSGITLHASPTATKSPPATEDFRRTIDKGRLTKDQVRRKVEIFEGRLTSDEVRRKSEFSSPSHFVNPPFVLRHSPRADQRKGC
jgi:hypothetical protein